MPRILSNIAGTGWRVGCLVLTVDCGGGVAKGLLNKYFFGDVRWVGEYVVVTIN